MKFYYYILLLAIFAEKSFGKIKEDYLALEARIDKSKNIILYRLENKSSEDIEIPFYRRFLITLKVNDNKGSMLNFIPQEYWKDFFSKEKKTGFSWQPNYFTLKPGEIFKGKIDLLEYHEYSSQKLNGVFLTKNENLKNLEVCLPYRGSPGSTIAGEIVVSVIGNMENKKENKK